MWIKGTLRQASVLGAMALAAALTLVGLVPTAAHAATGCRTITPSISGAYFQGTICYETDDLDMWWVSDEYDEVTSYLQDTAKDGRRAELWVGYTSSGAEKMLELEATCGVGCVVYASDLWDYSAYPYNSSQAKFRVCTSDAGASRKCGSWY